MTAHLQGKSRWLAFAILCLGDLMIVLDLTVVNVALPTIRSAWASARPGWCGW